MPNGWWRRCGWGLSVVALAAGCAGSGNGGWTGLPANLPFRGLGGMVPTSPPASPGVDVEEVPWRLWGSNGIKDPAALHVAYGRWQEELGRLAEARDAYERALHEDDESIDALLGLARVDQISGRLKSAEERFRKAVRYQPDDPRTHDALGEFLALQSRFPEAIDELTAATQLTPDESEFRYHLAVALVRSGDEAAAMPHFAKTVGEAEGLYNVGFLMYQQGKFDEAEQYLVQATVKRPDLLEAQQMLDQIRSLRDDHQLASNGTGQPSAVPITPRGWPHRAGESAPPPVALDLQRSHLAGYGEPGQNVFVPAGYSEPAATTAGAAPLRR